MTYTSLLLGSFIFEIKNKKLRHLISKSSKSNENDIKIKGIIRNSNGQPFNEN